MADGQGTPDGLAVPDMGITELGALTQSAKEVYDEYCRAGFQPQQALYLTACTFQGNPGFAPPGHTE